MTCGNSNNTKKRRHRCRSLGATTVLRSDARRTAAASMLLMRVLLLLLAVVVTLPRRFVTSSHHTGRVDPARQWRSDARHYRRGFFSPSNNDHHHDAAVRAHHHQLTTQDRRRRHLQQQQQTSSSSSSPIVNGSYVNLTVLYNDADNHHQRGCDDEIAYKLEGLLNGVYSCRCEDANSNNITSINDGFQVVCVTSQPVVTSDDRAVTLNTTIYYSVPTGHMVSFRSCYRSMMSTSSTATGRTSGSDSDSSISGWAAATMTEEGCIDATLANDCHQVSTCTATLAVENGPLVQCASCRACDSTNGVDAPAPYPSQELLLSLDVNCTNVYHGAHMDGCNMNKNSSDSDWDHALFPYYASVVDAATFLSSTTTNAATETTGTSSSAMAQWSLLSCGRRRFAVASALGGFLLVTFVGSSIA